MHEGKRESLLLALAKTGTRGGLSLEDTLVPIAGDIASGLDVARVSVWLYRDDDAFLECAALCDGGKRAECPASLEASAFPRYFSALTRARALAATDASEDERTSELTESYLRPLGIASMLDAPIYAEGSLTGILCCETRERREWSSADERVVASIADLLARILLEHHQNELNLRVRSLLEASAQAVLVIDEAGIVRLSNSAAERCFGKDVSKIVGESAESLVAPSHRGLFHKAFERFFEGITPEKGAPPTISLALRADGREFPVEVTVSAVEVGGRRNALALISDISERVRTERELAKREELYRRVVEEQDDLILRADPRGNVLFANGATLRFVHGDEAREVRNLLDYVPEPERDFVLSTVRPLSPEEPSIRYEHHVIRHDGKLVLHSFHTRAFFQETGRLEGYQAIGRDIARERENEALLREAQRLEALAVLSSGIAHDFNNLLTPIMALAELVLFDVEEGSETADSLRQILQASDRARDLVRQILTFARRENGKTKVAASVAIREAVAFVRASLSASIQLLDEVDSDCGEVLAAPADLYQIVSNLCTNAIQAMPGGGVLSVVAEKIIRAPEASVLQILVRDTGIGMSEEVRRRIFEPFFTTKGIGQGTGLGLSVVFGTVKSIGGTIDVQSVPGKGTTFLVELPLENKSIEKSEEPAQNSPLKVRRALVVDDEPAVALSVRRMLEQQGLPVTTRHSANEAIVEFARDPEAFGLVVTDLTMPHLGGIELAFRLRQIRANIPIVLMSGFGEIMLRSEHSLLPGMILLPKPFSQRELHAAIEAALEASMG